MIVKKTKIVATLGPSTSDKQVVRDMVNSGVNVFRINFSHADYDHIKQSVKMIREINEEEKVNVAILADLQGPKLRVGVMKEGIVVKENDEISFITGVPFEGDENRAYMNYEQFPKDVKAGEKILLDDGKLIFEIVETNHKDTVKTKVIQGGSLKSKKGVNLPNTDISLPALTEKDVKDAIFALSLKVDWIALSFVRHQADIKQLRDLISEHSDYPTPIIAKIEKPEAITNIDEIIENCQAIMVARGDLGVEIPSQEVPLLQKMIVNKTKLAHKPVVIATQMMETMIDSLTPTRAEVNDVANSIMDGADAVMLSGETSVGQYPVQVIQKMSSIIQSVEDSELIKFKHKTPRNRDNRHVTNLVCFHASTMSKQYKTTVISTLTNSGYTAYQISSYRPNAHILVFTSNTTILTQLSLLWGVDTFYYDKHVSTDETIDDVNRIACKKRFLQTGDTLISLAAMPVKEKGMVNTLRLTQVDSSTIDFTKK